MKAIKFLFLTIMVGLFASCDEGDLNPKPVKPKYDVSDSKTDSLQHYKHVFNRDYGVIIIDNPDSTDYKYTISSTPLATKFFAAKLGKDLKDEELEKAKDSILQRKLDVLQALNKVFYKKFGKNVVHKLAPRKLILADSIGSMEESKEAGQEGEKWESTPFFFNKTIMGIAMNERECEISKDKSEIIFKKKLKYYTQRKKVSDLILGATIINDLEKEFGWNWVKQFAALTGELGKGETVARIDFEDKKDGNYDDVSRPMSEFPGIKEKGSGSLDNPEILDSPKMLDYARKLGYPRATEVKYSPAQEERIITFPGFPPIVEPAIPENGRVRFLADILMVDWIVFASNTDGAQKEELFKKYPKLRENYLIAQKLIKKHTNIDI